MKFFTITLLLSIYCTNVYSQCDVLDIRYRLSLSSHLRKAEKLIEIPKNSEKISIEFTNSINNYITQYNSLHRSEEFHTKEKEYIEKLPDGERKKHILKTYAIYKHYTKDIYNSFTNLVKQKHIESLYCLGRIHEYGIGVKINYIEAWAWYNTAFAVEGIKAKKHQERVWEYLDWEGELEGQRLSDIYISKYTNIPSTPSTSILR